jgi:outer membrane protein OmpA-like peptidoglycan-associated protein
MYKFILPSVLLIGWIGLCAYLSSTRCCGTGLDDSSLSSSTYQLTISDLSDVVAKADISFDFPYQQATLLHSISAPQLKVLRGLSTYLEQHPDRRLLLTGYYTKQEKNINADLGLERARLLKQELQHFGIPSLQVVTQQDLSIDHDEELPILKDAIQFEFTAMPEVEQLVEEMQLKMDKQKVILHFDVAEEDIDPTPTQLSYFDQLQQYLDQHPNATIKITGYTDDQGEPRQNVRLGRERALMVKNFLLNRGFDREHLLTESAGERDPISSNASPSGRAKNRRVEIQLVAE